MVKLPLLTSVVDSLMDVRSSKVSVSDRYLSFLLVFFRIIFLFISYIPLKKIEILLGVPDASISLLKIFLRLILLALHFEEAISFDMATDPLL